MMSLGISAWLAAHLRATSARQQEISQALKTAHEQNSAANLQNIEESEKAIAEPIASPKEINAKTSIESLLAQISKNRKLRRDQTF